MLNFKIETASFSTDDTARTTGEDSKVRDLIIIGAGPAGLTAAIYVSRAMFDVLILEKVGSGGQMALTHNIENYPGFPEGINGYDLSMKMEEQAKNFGTQFEYATVSGYTYNEKEKYFEVQTDGSTFRSKSVLVAAGVHPRKVEIPGEDKFYGRGISYCATCDGAFYKDKEVVVIGGGEAALEEAIFLTRFATKVTIIHRRDEFRATKLTQERAKAHKKMEFILDTVATEFVGEDKLEGVRLKNKKTGNESFFKTDGVFIFIGQLPNTEMVPDQFKNEEGFIQHDAQMCISHPGVFAAGDCVERPLKQIATAVGDGTMASHYIQLFLEGLENEREDAFLNQKIEEKV